MTNTQLPTDAPLLSSFVFHEARILTAEPSSDRRALLVFQWLAALERDLPRASLETIRPYQAGLETALLRLVVISDPAPAAPLRSLIARCLVRLYDRGDTRSLFDTLAGLQGLLAKHLPLPSPPSGPPTAIKLSLLQSIGLLTEAHGSKLLSLFPESLGLALKALKGARDADIPLRHAALIALSRSITGAGRSTPEQSLKEILKYARSGLTDKYAIIKRASAGLLEAIYKYTPQPPPLKVDEYEALLVLLTKAIEGGSDYQLRQAVASAAASILALSQTKAPNPPKEAARRFPLFLMGSAPTPTETSSSSDMRSILSTEEMLAVLAKLINKASSSPQRGTRIALLEAYAALLRQLGVDYIESNYMVITSAILDLGVPAPSTQQSRSGAPPNTNATDAALLTSAARFLLRDCLGKRLSELGQVRAVNELVSNWIQRWPPTGAEQAPSEGTLVLVLDEISALLLDLGPAAASSQDALIDPLAIILAHTSQVVNLALSWTLHCFCRSLPNQLPKLIGKIVSLLQRDTGPANADKLEHMDRIIGYANALAGLLCVVPLRPLYIAYESAAVVFGISTQLLRNANVVSRDSALGATQSLVAWTLVGSLMTLGSQFVKVHISQLLLIWKNCFPKSQGKDLEPRTEVEWNALLINRYAALSALYSFLIHNKDLVTPDIAKRLVVVLNNTLAFLQTLPTSYTAASLPQDFVVSTEAFQMKLVNREALIKVRLMQSYAAIEPSYYDMMGPQLLKLSLEQFLPDPDRMDRFAASMYNPNDKAPLPEVNIANTLIDGYQPMVASNVGADDRGLGNALRYDTDVAPLEALMDCTAFGAIHYDPASIYLANPLTNNQKPQPFLPAVSLSNAAIELFVIVFPLQSASAQETALDTMIRYSYSNGQRASASRKYALQLNAIVAIIGALKRVMVKKGTISTPKAQKAIQDLVQGTLSDSETLLRVLSAETLGRLCRIVDNPAFVNTLIQSLIDKIVNNRDPDSRTGSSLALGTISGYMGGMASGPHLKNIVGIFHSLAADSHCLVHSWALRSLWLTIESAGLMYGPYVNSTLSLVTKLFMSETHEETALQANLADGGSNSDVLPAFGRILLALVDVLGPELQSSPKVRELFFSLYDQLKNDDDPFTVTEAIRCVQQFILFAPKLVDIQSLVPFLQRKLAIDSKSQVHVMRKAAVHCLYQLSQKDAGRVLGASVDNKLEEQLFGLLDIETDSAIQDEIKDILANFLKHVAPQHPSRWLYLCRSILAKGNVSDSNGVNDNSGLKSALSDDGLASPGDDQPDEEARGSPSQTMNTVTSTTSGSPLVFVLLPRWRTQIYALTCLRMVLSVTFESGVKEHFDLGLARDKTATMDEGDQPPDFLIFKLVELIRISFSTATANLYELKLEGLLFLKDILDKYSSVPDPDLDESALLEQYQAQIISALAPAFEDGNGPELVATASQVCAHYMGSGIHQDISTLARLSKLMTGLLDTYKDVQGQESLPNGKIILKISVLSSWADFYLASRRHPELVSIVNPNLPALSVHWYSTLYDYAKLTIENDVAGDLQFLVADKSMSAKNTNAYMAAVKQITLPYYQKSWISVLEALTCQLDHSKSDGINDPEQIQMFHMLLGLCVDAINTLGTVGISQGNEFASKAIEVSKRNLKTMTACLEGISKLLQMAYNGTEELDKTIFTETMTVLDRLMQTEGVGIQEVILGIVQTVLDTYLSSFFIESVSVIASPEVITGSADSNIDILSGNGVSIPSSAKLYKILKVVCNVFLYHIPGLSNHTATSYVRSQFSASDSVALIGSALHFLTALITKPVILQKHYRDLVPFAFFIYTVVLQNDEFAQEVGPKVLFSIKTCLDCLSNDPSVADDLLVGDVLQKCIASLLEAAQFDDSESPDDNAQSTQNALFAVTLIVTMLPVSSFTAGNQETFVEVLLGNLKLGNLKGSSKQLSSVSNQCIRKLLLLSAIRDKDVAMIGSSYARLILPGLVSHLLQHGESIKSGSSEDSAFIEDILKTLLTLHQSISVSTQKDRVLDLLVHILMDLLIDIPELSSLPKFSSMADRHIFNLSTQILMQLVSQNQASFRVLVASLPSSKKVKLERALKSISTSSDLSPGTAKAESKSSPSGSAPAVLAQPSLAPKIQLKNFASFGS